MNGSEPGLNRAATEAAIHIFDVDHTLTRHSTGRRFAQAGVDEGVFSRRALLTLPVLYLRYRLGRLSLSDVTREIKVIRGMARARLRELSFVAQRRYLDADLYPAALAHLDRVRSTGARIALASTSFDVILEPLAERLAVDEIVCSELEYDQDDRATGWLVGGPCYAEQKATRIRLMLERLSIDPRRAAFYSDSFHDAASLRLAGYPIAVNPDRALRRLVRRVGWPVAQWATDEPFYRSIM